MKVISLVKHRFEDGDFTGVPRFDFELRKAIPGLISLNMTLFNLLRLYYWVLLCPKDIVVITSSELSIKVPSAIKTIVVLHGCAQTHFDRDPFWRDRMALQYCHAQRQMYTRPNRWFVSPARWTSDEFSRHYQVPAAQIIPHWVEVPLRHASKKSNRPIVLGDWRNFNKGKHIIESLKQCRPDLEFRTLNCTYETRHHMYQDADVYLCLSASEGGSYSMSDAVACGLPVVTTDVGNYHEYDVDVILWQDREQPQVVSDAIDRALSRPQQNFFATYSLELWSQQWSDLLNTVIQSEVRN
jgi:glycosyltransferase involved in cell wall biosynthesis